MALDLVLAGDIGGTNCRLTLFSIPHTHRRNSTEGPESLDGHTALFGKTYKNEGVHNFDDVLHTFFRDAGVKSHQVAGACFAVAGPVRNDHVTFTNLGWVIDGRSIETSFSIPSVKLINDFVAVGYGLLTLRKDQYQELQAGEHDPAGPIACVGAGTGLGEVYLTTSENGRHTAFGSEGGHKDYCAKSDLEIELLVYLRKKFSGRVSIERVVSGKGLMNVYEFLREKYPDEVVEKYDSVIMNEPSEGALYVSKYKYDYPLCATAMKLMIRAYGTETGNLALQYLPFGGMYITQALILKNLAFFLDEKNGFLAAYRDKGRVAHFTDKIPLRIALVDDLGMKGAHLVAARVVKDLHLANFPTPEAEQPGVPASNILAVAAVAAVVGGIIFMRSRS